MGLKFVMKMGMNHENKLHQPIADAYPPISENNRWKTFEAKESTMVAEFLQGGSVNH